MTVSKEFISINDSVPSVSVYDFYQEMAHNNLIMIYEGEFNQEITKTVLSMTEKNIDSEGVDSGVKKKIFNVMVECLQNICKHQYVVQSNNDEPIGMAIFMIGYKDGDYLVITGNPIKNEKIEALKNKLEKINSLDSEGLKAYYKEARLSSTISSVGGAGLGFIDIARKSENKLLFDFKPINEKYSFFSFVATISSKKDTN